MHEPEYLCIEAEKLAFEITECLYIFAKKERYESFGKVRVNGPAGSE